MPPRGEPTHRAPRIPSELDVSLSRRFGGVLPGTALARRVHDPARPLAHTLLGKGRRGTHQFGGLESTPEPGVIEIPPSSSERSPAPRFEPPLICAPAGDLLFEATTPPRDRPRRPRATPPADRLGHLARALTALRRKKVVSTSHQPWFKLTRTRRSPRNKPKPSGPRRREQPPKFSTCRQIF